jgi:hypothetical protein
MVMWGLIEIHDVSPADCNEIPDEILEGRGPRCRVTHLSGPIWVVRPAGPLHLLVCRRLSHRVGGVRWPEFGQEFP